MSDAGTEEAVVPAAPPPERQGEAQKPVDIWRPVPPLAEVRPIVPASDPTALLRSLGEPPSPLPGAAEIAVAQVIDRAAGLATALAAAGGLLAMPGDEPDDDEA